MKGDVNMSRRKTTDDFKKEVKNLVGDEYTVLGEYKTNKDKIDLLHKKCSQIYSVTPNHFLNRGHRCSNCSTLKKKTTEDFRKEVEELGNNDYILIGEYKNNLTKVKILHINCNHTYEVTPANFIQGYRCPKCNKKVRKTTEIFKKEVEELSNGKYELLSEYKNNKTKVEILHKECNTIFEMRPNDFQQGNRCPKCSSLLPHGSKGIQIIREYLSNKGFIFKEEVTFPDCKYKQRLRFDFVIYDLESNIIFSIEYDGKQHYKPTFNNENKFNEQQIRDVIKNNYCKEKNIPLIRVSYKEKNISNYLNKCLTTIEKLR